MRIAIVNDLRLACEALRRAVASGGHEVAWIATDGAQAVARARADRPDLVLMDMIMPGMDGVEATRRIMREAPCPILVVTSTVSGNIAKVFEALGCGALDVVETPSLGPGGELGGAAPLLEKIRRLDSLRERPAAPAPCPAAPPRAAAPAAGPGAACPLVLLGASTGGPKVLAEILAALPRDLPAAVVIAQHVDPGYAGGLARWLGEQVALPVELARDGQAVAAGRVYVAPSDRHLAVGRDRRLAQRDEPCGACYRPSVDVLFGSAARHAAAPGVAVLLTGMGRDGAAGLAALRAAGWTTIAQDKESSVVWGMPRAAVEDGAAARVLPARAIAPAILAALSRRHR